ncbi:hypothetical protein BMA721280_I0153 [Burkholderia mallei 2002721280]|nr:hypothetical protein BMAFMH_K0065 [Burkholderia mallei FMH]EDK86604.1 hypothetical protein BMA721280_I0153 [Burkholderia mallei 2002721280]
MVRCPIEYRSRTAPGVDVRQPRPARGAIALTIRASAAKPHAKRRAIRARDSARRAAHRRTAASMRPVS